MHPHKLRGKDHAVEVNKCCCSRVSVHTHHLPCEQVANEVLCLRRWCSNNPLPTGGVSYYVSFFSGKCDLEPSLAVLAFSSL